MRQRAEGPLRGTGDTRLPGDTRQADCARVRGPEDHGPHHEQQSTCWVAKAADASDLRGQERGDMLPLSPSSLVVVCLDCRLSCTRPWRTV